jgi:hypothetical protein
MSACTVHGYRACNQLHLNKPSANTCVRTCGFWRLTRATCGDSDFCNIRSLACFTVALSAALTAGSQLWLWQCHQTLHQMRLQPLLLDIMYSQTPVGYGTDASKSAAATSSVASAAHVDMAVVPLHSYSCLAHSSLARLLLSIACWLRYATKLGSVKVFEVSFEVCGLLDRA